MLAGYLLACLLARLLACLLAAIAAVVAAAAAVVAAAAAGQVLFVVCSFFFVCYLQLAVYRLLLAA